MRTPVSRASTLIASPARIAEYIALAERTAALTCLKCPHLLADHRNRQTYQYDGDGLMCALCGCGW